MVEHWSPKPAAGSSSLSTRAKNDKMKITEYIRASYNELVNEVTWPEWSSLQKNTVQVLVASLIIALILFGMDKLSRSVLDIVYGL